jgi:hypothetical protein
VKRKALKNKRIAILTLPPISNYGGILQNFALQQALKKLGSDPITIDRRSYNPLKESLRRLKNLTFNRLKGRRYLALNKTIKDFIYKEPSIFKSKYINITEPVLSAKALKRKADDLNIYSCIVGSDQIWRPPYNPNIYDYYLDFIKSNSDIKKIAYAASFGVDEWEYTNTQTRKCQKLAQLFDKISVRECSGKRLCNEFLKVEATCVVDPTMLLAKEDYLNLIDFSKVPKREGLYTYFLDDNKAKRSLVKQVGATLQLKEFKNQPNAFQGDLSKDVEDFIVPSIEGWVKGFDQADFIITDSFHGTVFSIIFNKPFLAVINKQKGASRFLSLLEMLGLQNRLVDEDCDIERKMLKEDIDYQKINSKINAFRGDGLDFLKQFAI